jgi:hypothetical protein
LCPEDSLLVKFPIRQWILFQSETGFNDAAVKRNGENGTVHLEQSFAPRRPTRSVGQQALMHSEDFSIALLEP